MIDAPDGINQYNTAIKCCFPPMSKMNQPLSGAIAYLSTDPTLRYGPVWKCKKICGRSEIRTHATLVMGMPDGTAEVFVIP